MCTVPILRLLPQYEEVKGVSVLRRDERRDFWPYDIDGLLPQNEEVKGVGVGVSRMAKNNAKYSRMCTNTVNNSITTEFTVQGGEASW
mmetsp:Transcript_38883/g.43561  ORF Transcript_38883/g.43561 Transcript_38883/m.43561 type:complete len:88 (-) Transcript_38883:164-427(-)